MTPAARLSAAIAVLDRVLGGEPAEKALTNWGRASRYAGSGDRAAVRDLVFEALRRRSSSAALGGGLTGRGLVLGLMRAAGQGALFSGEGHAPGGPGPEDAGREPSEEERLDLPIWLVPELSQSLGADLEPVAEALRSRAPVFLRVNLGKTDVAGAVAALAYGVAGEPAAEHATADSAECLGVADGGAAGRGAGLYRPAGALPTAQRCAAQP